MNAPETIPTPINSAHEVLLKSDIALCVEDVARAIVGKKPTKADIKSAAKLLKEIADLGMIEMKPRTGGVPFYRLITAPTPEVCDSVQTEGSKQTEALEPERVLTPEAEAERDQFEAEYGHGGNCSCHISPPCNSCLHPGNPINQEADETAWMAAAPAEDQSQPLNFATSPELQFLAPEDYEIPPADPVLLAMANKMLGDRLDGVAHVLRGCGLPLLADASGAEDLQPKVAALSGAYQMALADLRQHEACLEAKDSELLAQTKVVVDLRDRLDALTQQWEALQEQDGVDVKDAAVGYLIRVTKRKPRYVTQPERARDAALAAVRAGAGRAEVLAVVPVGVARRGAEWRGSAPQAKGD